MMYNLNDSSDELWAILDKNERVMWTRGGSSTNPKLMVYSTAAKAKAGISRMSPAYRVEHVPHIQLVYKA